MIRRLAAVAVVCVVASPLWAGVKEDQYQQMIGIAQQMRDLRASGSSSSAQYAALASQYAQLSASLGGDDPAATLPDGSPAVDGRSPSAPVGSMGEIPPPPPGCISQVQQFTNNTPVPISSTGTPVVTSTQVVAVAGAYLWDLNLRTFITHTFSGDLDVTIQSPAGTVVTLTTDNGSLNDNVFNGTVWDDQANPGGQVPYSSNDGLVAEHAYSNLTLASPLVGEEALGAFIGEDPNGTWTLTISDDTNLDGGSLESWTLEIATLPAAPSLTTNGFGSPTPVPIPSTGTPVVTSTIVVAGLGTSLVDLNVTTNILHTFASDLDVTIQSPAGTVVTLTTDNGSSFDNVFNGTLWDDDSNPGSQVPYTSNQGQVNEHTYVNVTLASPLLGEEALAAFTGEDPNGVWTLTISDDANQDGGTLNGWSIEVQTATCLAACELTCPANVTTGNDAGQCGAVVNYPAPTTNGDCGPIVCTPPSGGFFGVGTTQVFCAEDTGGDGSGGGNACGFEVTVNDTQPPSLTAPPNQNVGTDAGVCTAVVNFPAPVVSDNCPGIGVPVCTPPSGSTFNLGTTPASCQVLDGAGNSAAAGFSVTVFDDEPPALTCPADVFAAAPPGVLSWPVNFPTPTPTDNCPGVAAACDPASGDSFPVGTTTDVCTATDGAGLTSTCDFDVTVAEQAIQEIPTASTLGLAALALLLAGAAFVALRRHG